MENMFMTRMGRSEGEVEVGIVRRSGVPAQFLS